MTARALMIHSRSQRFFVLSALLIVLVGCDETVKNSILNATYTGNAVPNARIVVSLDRSMNKYDLFVLVEKAARLGGFPVIYGGQPRTPDMPDDLEKPRLFEWIKRPDASHYENHYLVVFWDEQVSRPASLTFALNAPYNHHNFNKEDWLIVDAWVNSILPKVFPNAQIALVRHPAEFTKFSELMQISDATKMEVPAKILVQYDAWLEKTVGMESN